MSLRAVLGGMSCDVSMMRDFVSIWFRRWTGKEAFVVPRGRTAPGTAGIQVTKQEQEQEHKQREEEEEEQQEEGQSGSFWDWADHQQQQPLLTSGQHIVLSDTTVHDSASLDPWLRWLCDEFNALPCNMRLQDLGPLVPAEIILSAVDFHCTSIVRALFFN